ncbi:hypothetical protein Patl1_21024 [Pistacia atlantica]|uniref:Uncharacterized protein n=1 Tax=Pistacia atlantica TaxID=434234 RepID=A0ACC1BH93_9ROSI|nr:hypothetical protein Patl1_21024 [Pistacia atlantica]
MLFRLPCCLGAAFATSINFASIITLCIFHCCRCLCLSSMFDVYLVVCKLHSRNFLQLQPRQTSHTSAVVVDQVYK